VSTTAILGEPIIHGAQAGRSLSRPPLSFTLSAQMTTNGHPSTERLQQLNRMYRTISRCNRYMIRAEDEKTLAQDFCSVMVEEGGYRMAWVG